MALRISSPPNCTSSNSATAAALANGPPEPMAAMRYRLNKLNIATDDIVDENEPEESSESEGQ
jgi:hypothetical protein